jgi:DNA-binding transcriptional LysR family regulator
MELRHLRYFVALAEELSFTAAAARLRISQPPLSQQIRDLELELGTALFTRTSRHVALTAAGTAFLGHARAILDHAAQAAAQARAIGAGTIGTLDVGTTGTVMLGPLSQLIAAFSTRHPGVTVRMHEMPPHDQVSALRDHRVDICFMRAPPAEPDLRVDLAWREKVGIVCPETHRLARFDAVPLTELRDERQVFLRLADSRFANDLREACVAAGFMPIISQEVVEAFSQMSFVAAGLGVALVPETISTISRAGIVYRPLQPPALSADVMMVTRRDRTATTTNLLAIARDILPGQLPQRIIVSD